MHSQGSSDPSSYWDGDDIFERYDWNYRLIEEDLSEIEAALVHFKSD